MRPLVPSLREASERLYAQIRPVELAARADGASRDEAAELGLGLLLRGLETLGMADADDLALVTLPAELAAYERVAGGLPRRQGAVGPMADLLAAMHDVQARTAGLVAQLDEYSGLIAALESSYADAAPVAARLLAVADATAEGSRLDAVVDAARAAAVQMWEAARAAGCERDVRARPSSMWARGSAPTPRPPTTGCVGSAWTWPLSRTRSAGCACGSRCCAGTT